MTTIRWGMIGCGDVAEVKSGPGFQEAEGSALVAVMRRNGAMAADYASRHGVARSYDDADALIADPEVDAVYIATPPGSHLEYALRVAAAGKPAYVEKPMARCAAECREMIDAFESRGLPLFVAYYRRSLPRFVKAKQIIDEGRIGPIVGVSYRFSGPSPQVPVVESPPWRLVAPEAGGGLFMDLGCHTLDILDFLVGPLADVAGSALNLAGEYDVEDTVSMQFRTGAGAPGAAFWSFATSARDDRIEILGNRGRLSLSTFGAEPVWLNARPVIETFDLPNPPTIQRPMIQAIVDQVRGGPPAPSSGHTALRTAVAMDIALAGYYGSRDEGFWDRPETWPGRRS